MPARRRETTAAIRRDQQHHARTAADLGAGADGMTVTWAGGPCVLRLTGAVDLASAPLLSGILDATVAGGCSDVRLDMADVSFMSCSGLTVLLRAHSELAQRRGRLLLHRPSAAVRRLVCLADLCEHFGLRSGPHTCAATSSAS